MTPMIILAAFLAACLAVCLLVLWGIERREVMTARRPMTPLSADDFIKTVHQWGAESTKP